ncbi:MAG: immunity 49 family protein [Caldilineaceae bacterium]|nr:immunity 49 family protein [Caldilineaceae bacterium]
MLTSDVAGWNDQLYAALQRHADYWEQIENRYDPTGFLALNLLGLSALAGERGLETEVDSPYLPHYLVEGKCGPHSSDVVYHFPKKEARSIDEAHLFMDLQGCAAASRSHELAVQGECLVARYECEQVIPAERLAFEFILPEAGEAKTGVPFTLGGDQPSSLIDAGQFLWLADQITSSIPASREGLSDEQVRQRELGLRRAISYLQEALKFYLPGSDQLPDQAIWSEVGHSQFDAEPGRFQRGRLEATLHVWQQLLDEEPPPPNEHAEAEARAQTLLALETIKAQVRPLLAALPTMPADELAQAVQPRTADYNLVFQGIDATWLQAEYDRLWAGGIDLRVDADQTVLEIHAAPAGMLAYENELSFPFPGGYRACADLLNPRRIWVAWKYRRPDANAGMAFDGLVWVDDHWAWFPKPFRLLKRWRER